MLIYFTIGNFKSIKEKVTIDFSAASLSEHHQSNVIDDGKRQAVKTVLLYGPNASGKSKILDAFVLFKWLILYSAGEMETNGRDHLIPFSLSTETEGKPCFFEVCFVLDGTQYRYGCEVDRELIHKEWLLESSVKTEFPVFLRIKDSFEINRRRFANSSELDKRTKNDVLFLSVAAQWNVEKAEKIVDWFSSISTVHSTANTNSHRQRTVEMIENKKYHQLIQQFISMADLGINSIAVSSNTVKTSDSTSKDGKLPAIAKRITAEHNKYDKRLKVIGTKSFDLDLYESDGTIKLFNIIGRIILAIVEDRLIIMDEFDSRLHTILSKAILRLFNSPVIKSRGQLLAASHDTGLLDNNILRRDQIYFIEKNKFGATKAVNLAAFKTRKESPFNKNYIEGKYGAIPFIADLETLIANAKKEK